MSTTSAIDNTSTLTSTLGSSGSSITTQQDFFKLLIAQLQNQDPMNPQDNQEFMGQLAQFSSLEQATNQTKLLQQLVESNTADSSTQALSLIGKEVTVTNSGVAFQPGDEINMLYNTDAAANVPVTVTNSSGAVVFTETVTANSSGMQEYTFDGKLPDGSTLPSGKYTVAFGGATDSKGNQTNLDSYILGTVDGVNFVDGDPVLMVQGQSVQLSSVMAVYASTGK